MPMSLTLSAPLARLSQACRIQLCEDPNYKISCEDMEFRVNHKDKDPMGWIRYDKDKVEIEHLECITLAQSSAD